MLTELNYEITKFLDISRQYYPTMLIILGGLWVFNIINWQTGSKLNLLGIYPRHVVGLIGIPLAPLLHGDFAHLLFNSIPLFFLGIFIMSLNLTVFYFATAIIIFLSGAGVWCVGRKGIHIGASALISGYFGFILGIAYLKPTITTLFCAALAVYYFGSILLSLFPSEEKTSWEGHLCGFISGLIAMWICIHYLKLYTP